jgi:O-antigen/teichoic acid export membrane protein
MSRFLRRVIGKDFQATSVLALGDITGRCCAMLAWVMLAGQLGNAKFGLLSWGLAIVGYLSIFSDLGLGMMGARGLARGEDESFARSVRSLRLLLSASLFLATSVVACIAFGPETALVLTASSTWLIVNSLSPEWHFQGRGMMSRIAVMRFLSGFALLIVVVAARYVAADNVALAGALRTIADGFTFTIFLLLGWSRLEGSSKFSVCKSRDLLMQSMPLAGVSLLTALYAANFDVLVMAATRSIVEVGFYSVSYRLYLMLALFPKLFLVQAFPRFVASPSDRLQGELDRYYYLAGAVTVPGLVAVWLLAENIVSLLYGPDFRESTQILKYLAPAVMPLFLNAPLPSMLIAQGHTRPALIAFGAALVISVVVNLLATPALGAPAAAVAVFVAELSVLIVSSFACRRAFGVGLSPPVIFYLITLGSGAYVSVLLGGGLARWLGLPEPQGFAVTLTVVAIIWAILVFSIRIGAVRAWEAK